MSTAVIVGIAAGGAVLLALVAGVITLVVTRRKKRAAAPDTKTAGSAAPGPAPGPEHDGAVLVTVQPGGRRYSTEPSPIAKEVAADPWSQTANDAWDRRAPLPYVSPVENDPSGMAGTLMAGGGYGVGAGKAAEESLSPSASVGGGMGSMAMHDAAPTFDSASVYARSVSSWSASQAAQAMRINMSDLNVGDILGEGQFGKVYKCKWAGNVAAVKMLNLEGLDQGAKASFQATAGYMCQLHHPNVARMYGIVDEGFYQALVMQYYRRGSLAKALSALWFTDLKSHQRLKIAMQVASGMSFLHHRRPTPLIHGDLKLANILLDDDGHRVVIADGGLAPRLPSGLAADPDVAVATAAITAPELHADPEAPFTPATDVYAFGVVLFEIMACQPAFHRMREGEVRDLTLSGHRPIIPDRLQQGVQELIVQCWAQDPLARPSFDRLVTMLEGLLPARPKGARAGSASGSASISVGRGGRGPGGGSRPSPPPASDSDE